MKINHSSLPIFIDSDSSILILGSFPSVKSREIGFYYSHKQNRFFLTLSKILFEEEPKSIEERKEFLKKHHIALYDVIYSCDIINSDDASIKNVEVIDIVSILKEYPNINRIGLTGKKASSLFNKYLASLIDIDVYHLPSTSPANAKMKIEELVEQYKVLFL